MTLAIPMTNIMPGRGIVMSAGLGAMATMAGVYLVRKLRKYTNGKPRMKLFHKHLCLSTRCAWLISELGAEADFDVSDEEPTTTKTLSIESLPSLDDSSTVDMALVPTTSTKQEDDDVRYDFKFPDSAYDSFDQDLFEIHPPQLPTIVVNDEFTLIEGAAICMYLADLYGQFLPEEEYKSEYYSWIVYAAATFDNITKTLQRELADCSESGQDREVLDSAVQGFHAFARALSQSLENRDFLCGSRFTAADCVIGFTLWWAYTLDQGSLLDDHPVLLVYLKRLRQRPAFQKTFGYDADDWDWGRRFSTYVRGIQMSPDVSDQTSSAE